MTGRARRTDPPALCGCRHVSPPGAADMGCWGVAEKFFFDGVPAESGDGGAGEGVFLDLHRLCSGLQRRWVPGFVNRQFRAVRQPDCSQQSPPLIGNIPHYFDAFATQFGERCPNVVTHQVKLVAAVAVGRMDSKLGGWKGENEPASARVHRRQVKHILEERTDLLRFGREHDRMHAGDHSEILVAT